VLLSLSMRRREFLAIGWEPRDTLAAATTEDIPGHQEAAPVEAQAAASAEVGDGRTGLAMGIVLGVLGIGIGVGLAVGFATDSVVLGAVFGVVGTVAPVCLLWLLFGPLHRWTMKLLSPVLDVAVRAAGGLVTGLVSNILRLR
jgi:hypothetical protein